MRQLVVIPGESLEIEARLNKEMRELEIRLRNKMHGYARACLETIGVELKKEMKMALFRTFF